MISSHTACLNSAFDMRHLNLTLSPHPNPTPTPHTHPPTHHTPPPPYTPDITTLHPHHHTYTPDITVISHLMLAFNVPDGTGGGIDLSVEIDSGSATSKSIITDYTSNSLKFAYDPPYMTYVSPNTPNAEGDTISIYGKNFGSSFAAAGRIAVMIGGLPCDEVSASDDDGAASAVLWQKDGNEPYLWCTSSRLTVGYQAITVSVAGQNSTWTEEDQMIKTQCEYGYYGQGAWTVLTTADDPTCQECTEQQQECMQYYNATTGGYDDDEGVCKTLEGCVRGFDDYISGEGG